MPAGSRSDARTHGSKGQERRKASSVGLIAASLSSRLADRGRTGRLLAPRAQTDQELDQGAHLGRLDLLAVGRHVAAAGRAIADLIDELITRQAHANSTQVRSTTAPDAFQRVAVAALFVLEHNRSLKLQRRAF